MTPWPVVAIEGSQRSVAVQTGTRFNCHSHILKGEGVRVQAPLQTPCHAKHEKSGEDLNPLDGSSLSRVANLIDLIDDFACYRRNQQQ